jgi:hypothetical protein
MAEAMLRCAAPPNIGQSCAISGKGTTPASISNVKPILTFIPFRKPPAQWRLIVVTQLFGNCFERHLRVVVLSCFQDKPIENPVTRRMRQSTCKTRQTFERFCKPLNISDAGE